MLEELLKLVESFIRNIDGRFGRWIRYIYYKRRFGECGSNVVIEPGVFLQSPRHMILGDNIWIDRYAVLIASPFVPGKRKYVSKPNLNFVGKVGELTICDGVHIAPFTLIQAHGGLHIGQRVTVAAGAKIYTLSHHYRNLSDTQDTKRYAFSSMAPADDQFLIVSSVVLGNDSAVGLNAVVLPGTTIKNGGWLGVLAHLDGSEAEGDSVYVSPPAQRKTK